MRVRTLKAMNNLNHFLSMAIALLCLQAEKRRTSRLRAAILRHANGQRQEEDIAFILSLPHRPGCSAHPGESTNGDPGVVSYRQGKV
jgi:hypothetical protein